MTLSLIPTLVENQLVVYFENKPIRVNLKDDGPEFVLRDIAKCVDVANQRNIAARLEESEKGVHTVDTPGGPQEVITVTEAGLYRVIMTGRTAAAKRFSSWVTGEVLPAIRKNGFYALPAADPSARTHATLPSGQECLSSEVTEGLKTLSEDAKESAETMKEVMRQFDKHYDWAAAAAIELRNLVDEVIPASRNEIADLHRQLAQAGQGLQVLPSAAFSFAHVAGIPMAVLCRPDQIEGLDDATIQTAAATKAATEKLPLMVLMPGVGDGRRGTPGSQSNRTPRSPTGSPTRWRSASSDIAATPFPERSRWSGNVTT